MHTGIHIFFLQYCNSSNRNLSLINTKIKLNDNWSLFTEVQLRSMSFYDDFSYYELKGGANLKLSKNISLTAGLGTYQTFLPTGNFRTPKVNDEFRTWLQLNMNQNEKRLKLDHRYRVEQRWTSDGFRHRFRYRLNASLPISKKTIVPGTFFLNSSNELFFTTRAPYFIRNRFFAGCGYVFTETFSCQTGYMKQTDFSTSDKTKKGYIHISLLFNLDWNSKPDKGGSDSMG